MHLVTKTPQALQLDTGDMSNTHPLVIFANAQPANDGGFNGHIARIRVWDRRLSAQEVKTDFLDRGLVVDPALARDLVANLVPDTSGTFRNVARRAHDTGSLGTPTGAVSYDNDESYPGCDAKLDHMEDNQPWKALEAHKQCPTEAISATLLPGTIHSVEECYEACRSSGRCSHFSYSAPSKQCIPCTAVPSLLWDASAAWAYSVLSSTCPLPVITMLIGGIGDSRVVGTYHEGHVTSSKNALDAFFGGMIMFEGRFEDNFVQAFYDIQYSYQVKISRLSGSFDGGADLVVYTVNDNNEQTELTEMTACGTPQGEVGWRTFPCEVRFQAVVTKHLRLKIYEPNKAYRGHTTVENCTVARGDDECRWNFMGDWKIHCVAHTCVCDHGSAADDGLCDGYEQTRCSRCDRGYYLADSTCHPCTEQKGCVGGSAANVCLSTGDTTKLACTTAEAGYSTTDSGMAVGVSGQRHSYALIVTKGDSSSKQEKGGCNHQTTTVTREKLQPSAFFKIYAQPKLSCGGGWLRDGMNSWAQNEATATIWSVTHIGADKYVFQAQFGTTSYDGQYMQADCQNRKPSNWATVEDVNTAWEIPGFALHTDNEMMTVINANGQHLCSSLCHSTPPSCSYACDSAWSFRLASMRILLFISCPSPIQYSLNFKFICACVYVLRQSRDRTLLSRVK